MTCVGRVTDINQRVVASTVWASYASCHWAFQKGIKCSIQRKSWKAFSNMTKMDRSSESGIRNGVIKPHASFRRPSSSRASYTATSSTAWFQYHILHEKDWEIPSSDQFKSEDVWHYKHSGPRQLVSTDFLHFLSDFLHFLSMSGLLW